MNVLLSIKPRYVEAILKGDKRYEFRKNIFRNKDVENVYIYATSPVKKLVGFFKVGNILEDHPVCLWDQLKEFSGLDEKEFFSYFGDNKRGFGILFQDLHLLNPFAI
jgi:type I restriction enzyme S subunit